MGEPIAAFTQMYLMFGAMFLLGLFAIFMWIKDDKDEKEDN